MYSRTLPLKQAGIGLHCLVFRTAAHSSIETNLLDLVKQKVVNLSLAPSSRPLAFTNQLNVRGASLYCALSISAMFP